MISKRTRDVVILVAIAAVFAVTLAMLRGVVGFASPWFGLMLMFDFLGLVAFARPLLLLRLPAALREPRAWEIEGAIYKTLQVPTFGALLRRTALRFLNPAVYLSRNEDDPAATLAQLESAEAAHVAAAVVILPYIIHAATQGKWSAVAWLMAVQIVFNLYPVLHLRSVRFRLGRLHERMLSRRERRGRNRD